MWSVNRCIRTIGKLPNHSMYSLWLLERSKNSPCSMRILDEQLGDVSGMSKTRCWLLWTMKDNDTYWYIVGLICDYEAAVVRGIEKYVLNASGSFSAMSRFVAEIDWFVQWNHTRGPNARSNDICLNPAGWVWQRPQMTLSWFDQKWLKKV